MKADKKDYLLYSEYNKLQDAEHNGDALIYSDYLQIGTLTDGSC